VVPGSATEESGTCIVPVANSWEDQIPKYCAHSMTYNPSWMFSHVFDIKGSPKKQDGSWVKNETWLRPHQQDYDATYQEKMMTEAEYVEHLHHVQQDRMLAELCVKPTTPCAE
jgi:hypothetical protein